MLSSASPGASCTKLAYAQKSCVSTFSHKRPDVQRLTLRGKVWISTQTSGLAYGHFCHFVSWWHIDSKSSYMRPLVATVRWMGFGFLELAS